MSISPELSSAPEIELVPPGQHRPLWSVMIPAFNCAKYLGQTLESVLAQTPGPGEMQIEVVDDCSTKDDPESVVKSIGAGRVTFYHKDKNEGVVANFNTCLQRSRGYLVHLLHGDDYVMPGFYQRMSSAARDCPDASMFFCRCLIVEEDGTLDQLSPRCRDLEKESKGPGVVFYSNPVPTPGVVVQRSFYEQHGGFLPELVHVADWEMWIRALGYSKCRAINEILAVYRWFPGNDTSRLARTGENIRDSLRLSGILARRFPQFNLRKFKRIVATSAERQMNLFREHGDLEAADANKVLWEQITRDIAPRTNPAKRLLRKLLRS